MCGSELEWIQDQNGFVKAFLTSVGAFVTLVCVDHISSGAPVFETRTKRLVQKAVEVCGTPSPRAPLYQLCTWNEHSKLLFKKLTDIATSTAEYNSAEYNFSRWTLERKNSAKSGISPPLLKHPGEENRRIISLVLLLLWCTENINISISLALDSWALCTYPLFYLSPAISWLSRKKPVALLSTSI